MTAVFGAWHLAVMASCCGDASARVAPCLTRQRLTPYALNGLRSTPALRILRWGLRTVRAERPAIG